MYKNSSETGNIGETMALSEFARRRIPVLIPFGQNVPYDLVIQINNKFYKIQCKTTGKVVDQDKMIFSICRTNGFTGVHSQYSKEEIDFFFLHCIENGYCGIVPIDQVKSKREFTLRLRAPKNKQFKNIKMANNFLIDSQIEKIKST